MTINFTVQSDPIKIIKQGDSGFSFTTGLTFCNRAGIEIASTCPANYKDMLNTALAYGWIKPFAVMKESEFMWANLKEEQ